MISTFERAEDGFGGRLVLESQGSNDFMSSRVDISGQLVKDMDPKSGHRWEP